MILSNNDLKCRVRDGLIVRDDAVDIVVDLTSVCLHLGNTFIIYKEINEYVHLPSNLESEEIQRTDDECLLFPPGGCLLACTKERVAIPLDLMGFVQTKGTIARGFVTAHVCDAQIEPGFSGVITLELVNFSKNTYFLNPGTPIAQLFLNKLTSPVKAGYNGRYQHSLKPTKMKVCNEWR